ncbi:hypothetical protein, variant [Blastomyces dermatitidis ER-3]|uniref:Uncharacterized protein n=1 Tax=Ajellomyces dermatitidis (strain ER-3 / ATCC MYA-2586) TaxID=559297 RepID=A0ABX2VVG8_AJEDR|nr:uncharacterized protein BDCG_04448 [Blastomyces dermatitidis ER-3]XP_045280881.1 hypothetical protein, variant [Blastomyces dermatitidis ER-3]OAT01153.1 hypothetical protein BDCG_04448 [Blastomyces dermatitidis ER-3]OAT01154.1 hypothetical protein, variant [Blastomyces dermatitidis ER-3]
MASSNLFTSRLLYGKITSCTLAKWTDHENEPHDLSQLPDIQRVETQDRIGVQELRRQNLDCDYRHRLTATFKTPSLFANIHWQVTQVPPLRNKISTRLRRVKFFFESIHSTMLWLPSDRHMAEFQVFASSGRYSYTSTLLEKVNPQNSNRFAFLRSQRHRTC